MPRLPRLRGREVIAAFRRAGFVVLRVNRSHHSCDTRMDAQPSFLFTRAKPSPGLFNKILKDAEMELEEFQQGL